ncbi:4-hydroxymandelate oxidase [Lachnospiraceae bacterium PFB1-21]
MDEREVAKVTYQEIMEEARKNVGPYCKACLVCDGRACRNQMPGPGAKGLGEGAIKNYNSWQKITLNMDTITENKPVSTQTEVFGETFEFPIFAAPIGAMKLHYGDKYSDMEYNDILIPACKNAGIAAFTGDGMAPEVMVAATEAIRRNEGFGIPTVKPWDKDTILSKLEQIKESKALAVAMDIDSAGLPFLKNQTPPAGCKSEMELAEIIQSIDKPFIVKGIMTVKGAAKARRAGAKAIVVSNHGGRVLDGCPGTAEVLPEIRAAVGEKVEIFVDGGIRSGGDIFKALALGADAVLIGRPFVTALYGGGSEGVKVLVDKLGEELRDTMMMCGAYSLDEISGDMIRRK